MKLYQVPRNTKVVYTAADGTEYELLFHHVDGMYSFCTWHGEPFHLIADAEVELL